MRPIRLNTTTTTNITRTITLPRSTTVTTTIYQQWAKQRIPELQSLQLPFSVNRNNKIKSAHRRLQLLNQFKFPLGLTIKSIVSLSFSRLSPCLMWRLWQSNSFLHDNQLHQTSSNTNTMKAADFITIRRPGCTTTPIHNITTMVKAVCTCIGMQNRARIQLLQPHQLKQQRLRVVTRPAAATRTQQSINRRAFSQLHQII